MERVKIDRRLLPTDNELLQKYNEDHPDATKWAIAQFYMNVLIPYHERIKRGLLDQLPSDVVDELKARRRPPLGTYHAPVNIYNRSGKK